MPDRILTLRELNRATLSRQLLIDRAELSASEGVARLIGLQAQAAAAPFIGLWTRLRDFQRADLSAAIDARTVVKATTMRGTLHLLTAQDYVTFRTTFQAALTEGFKALTKRLTSEEVNLVPIRESAQDYIAESPRTFEQISAMLSDRWPNREIGPMRYGVRTHLPLIQVPVAGGWRYPGNPQFTLAESWLNQPIDPEDHLKDLIFRYLGAFGPAGVADIETWSGLKKLKPILEQWKPELQIYRDENRRELFDLPDLPIPDAETPVPARFLPEYDNVLLSHSNRTRILADQHRSHVYLPGLRVASTFLIDGFVAGTWQITKAKGTATLTMTPFDILSAQSQQTLREEAEQLIRFVEAEAKSYTVRFAEES